MRSIGKADLSIEEKADLLNGRRKQVALFFCILVFLVIFFRQNIYASQIFDKAEALMKDVYTNILKISTISAVVCSAVALIVMFFSKNGRAVDESRQWLKRIVITWIILNSLGLIVTYLTPLIAGGEYK